MKRANIEKKLVSVIIPVVNEEEHLGKTLQALEGEGNVETVVVDGGSVDSTVAIAKEFRCKVVSSQPGRGRQLNCGAAVANGDILLFLHGDTRLPSGFTEYIWRALARQDVAAGAFKLAIDSPRKGIQWVTRAANLRSRMLQLPYGDQAIFLRAEIFKELGGFPELPIMEDFSLVRSLRKRGRIHIVDCAVTTSARRWQRLGLVRVTMINQLVIAGFLVGLSPHLLAKLYGVVQKS